MTSLISIPRHIGPKRVGCQITEALVGPGRDYFPETGAFAERSHDFRRAVNLCIANDSFLICAKANGVLMIR
jgi:hypothetical protein